MAFMTMTSLTSDQFEKGDDQKAGHGLVMTGLVTKATLQD
jgi:hypothetical protein